MLMMMKTKESEGLRPDWIYKRGDVYWADLNPFFGSEQGGTRPVLVLQKEDGPADAHRAGAGTGARWTVAHHARAAEDDRQEARAELCREAHEGADGGGGSGANRDAWDLYHGGGGSTVNIPGSKDRVIHGPDGLPELRWEGIGRT